MFTPEEADKLELKAAGVLNGVIVVTQVIADDLTKNVDTLKDLDEVKKGILYFVLSYTLLYIAQKYFQARLFSENEKILALIFERRLFELFEANSGIDAAPFVADVGTYFQQTKQKLEGMYLMLRIPMSLGIKRDAGMFKMHLRFSAHTGRIFAQFLDRCWNLPENEQFGHLNVFLDNDRINGKERKEIDSFALMLKEKMSISELKYYDKIEDIL
ncbi:MAG: hypothetical protein G01um10147_1081 [Microgenomates group bacterium Gr01-1014_7]|nr:MAG: hypothetical protein G01um10147_1081 [Microgenomates group bacterium Gr01-1014_7]